MQVKPKAGFVANPLLGYPRNAPCLCESQKKWKQCCLPKMPRFIPAEEERDHKKMLKDATASFDPSKVTYQHWLPTETGQPLNNANLQAAMDDL